MNKSQVYKMILFYIFMRRFGCFDTLSLPSPKTYNTKVFFLSTK